MYLNTRIAGLIDQGDSSPQQQPQQPSMHIYLSSQTDRCVCCVCGVEAGGALHEHEHHKQNNNNKKKKKGGRVVVGGAQDTTHSRIKPHNPSTTHTDLCVSVSKTVPCVLGRMLPSSRRLPGGAGVVCASLWLMYTDRQAERRTDAQCDTLVISRLRDH